MDIFFYMEDDSDEDNENENSAISDILNIIADEGTD